MKFKYIYTLLTLILALFFVTASAQNKSKAKAKTKKAAAKVTAKKPGRTNTAQQKNNAKNLGEAAAKVTVDTTRKVAPAAGGSLSEEIVVTTAYKPVLADAVKIRINPDLDDKTPFKAPLTYTPVDKRLELNTDIKRMDPMKRPAERDSDLTNNYIKAGLGNLKTTYGEAYFNNGRDQALQVGGYLKHFAQDGSLPNQKSNKEQVGVFGKSIGEVNSLSGRIDYNYNGNYFYGFNPANVRPANLQADKQHFSTIGAEGELVKNYEDVENDFTYALKLKAYSFSDAYQAKESNVVLSGFLNETINQFYVGVSGSLDLSTQQDSLYDNDNSLIRLNPYIKFQGDSYKIEAGINIVDQFGNTSSLHIFPAAKLEFQVIPKYVRLFAEAKGDVNKSSLLDFYTTNPFLGQDVNIKNSIDQLDLAAGLKGTIAPGLSFKATIFRNMVKDMPLFVSNFNFANGYNRFQVIYDDGSSKVNGLTGELDYKASADVDIFGRLEYKDYKMATIAEPWNLPKYKITGGAVLHINDKIDVKGSLLIRSSILDNYAAIPGNGTPTWIGPVVDLSGSIEYKVTNRISVFVNVNNLLDGTNQTWLYYPDYGFNIFGGAGFAF